MIAVCARDPESEIARLRGELAAHCAAVARPLTVMEVCGTHTMAIARSGLRALLPPSLRLVSGPGCPVCVTEIAYIDHAIAIALQHRCIVATFGDLMRVPGSTRVPGEAPTRPRSLLEARAAGADVRVIYSPRDALSLARRHPTQEVVLLAVGFETTAPTIAATVLWAQREGLTNFSALVANKTVPPALAALASDRRTLALDGFLCPGHVSVVIGPEPYAELAERGGVACAIAGFEPVEILRGLVALGAQIATGQPEVANCYPAAVRPGGNPRAREAIERAFVPVDAIWRGLGTIAGSGLALRAELAATFDAARRHAVELPPPSPPRGCRCGDVLRGLIDPIDCPLFGRACTPDAPVGACMVSSEGSCAARLLEAPGRPR